MRYLVLIGLLCAACCAYAADIGPEKCLGVVRVFADQSSWLSSCAVIGDGGYALTTWSAVNESVGKDKSQTVRNPVFISAYTSQAWQCEVMASNKDLNIAILKLPVKGLPALSLAQESAFSKAKEGTAGDLVNTDNLGNRWPTSIYGVTRSKASSGYKMSVGNWDAAKVMLAEMGKYKWMFLIDVTPEKPIPNGAVIVKDSSLVGLYTNKLTIDYGSETRAFGRCAMSTEIARYLRDNGIKTVELFTPPAPTAKRGQDAADAFQLQAKLYTALSNGKPESILENANALAKIFPNDPQVKMMQGIGLTGMGKFDDANKIFDEISKTDPKFSGLRVSKALALVGLKKKSEAESELLTAAKESPTDLRPLIALVDFYFGDEKSLDNALTCAKRVETLAPDSPAAHLLVAKVLKRKGSYYDAVQELAIVIRTAPEWAEAWYAIGSTYEAAGDKDNAENAYRKLYEKYPENPRAMMTLASFLVDQGKKDEPAAILGKIRALSLAPPKEFLDEVGKLEEKIKGGDKKDDSKPVK